MFHSIHLSLNVCVILTVSLSKALVWHIRMNMVYLVKLEWHCVFPFLLVLLLLPSSRAESFLNPCCRISDYMDLTPVDIVGKRCYQFIHAEDVEGIRHSHLDCEYYTLNVTTTFQYWPQLIMNTLLQSNVPDLGLLFVMGSGHSGQIRSTVTIISSVISPPNTKKHWSSSTSLQSCCCSGTKLLLILSVYRICVIGLKRDNI